MCLLYQRTRYFDSTETRPKKKQIGIPIEVFEIVKFIYLSIVSDNDVYIPLYFCAGFSYEYDTSTQSCIPRSNYLLTQLFGKMNASATKHQLV